MYCPWNVECVSKQSNVQSVKQTQTEQSVCLWKEGYFFTTVTCKGTAEPASPSRSLCRSRAVVMKPGV